MESIIVVTGNLRERKFMEVYNELMSSVYSVPERNVVLSLSRENWEWALDQWSREYMAYEFTQEPDVPGFMKKWYHIETRKWKIRPDSQAIRAFRLQMEEGRYLIINGLPIRVNVTD